MILLIKGKPLGGEKVKYTLLKPMSKLVVNLKQILLTGIIATIRKRFYSSQEDF